MPDWLEKQRGLCEKLIEYFKKKKLNAIILKDSKKPYVRVFFSEKIFFDCQLKSIKSRYVQSVWLIPKMFFDRDLHYVVYDEKNDCFYIASGIDVIRNAKEELSTYKKKLVYLVVPTSIFIAVHAWVNRRKIDTEKKLQRKISDF